MSIRPLPLLSMPLSWMPFRLPARPGLVALKAGAGLALLLTAARYPSPTLVTLMALYVALFAFCIASRSIYRITWRHHRPQLARSARDPRASRLHVPRESVLGQAGTLLLQLVGYGFVMTFAWGASVAFAVFVVA